jgi:class 3 adenylate cyclase
VAGVGFDEGGRPINRYIRTFTDPDELIELDLVRSAVVSVGGIAVAHSVHQPGWRWSTHVRGLVKTQWCQVHHVGVLIRGRLHVVLQDGTEIDVAPLSLLDIPAGHDAWVVGDEPVETIEWTGAKEWLEPLDAMAERVLVTLLFTDLVDSTGTPLRLGRIGWGQLLTSHEQQARDIVARFRGRTVKTTGDGILASFDGAARAVRCAIALRDAAARMRLEMRTALHTAEVDVVDDDIRGIAIHEASRILALAGAGQVLVSATTAGLIGDAGIKLDDLGEHELRGLEKSYRIYAIS